MPLYEFEGMRPTIADDAFIAPTATIIGDVTIESGASVWYGAVLRGDVGPIVVRRNANVQDGTVIHTTPEVTTEIGPGATIAHQCMIHGAVVEEEALVGNGCVRGDERAVSPSGCRDKQSGEERREDLNPSRPRRRTSSMRADLFLVPRVRTRGASVGRRRGCESSARRGRPAAF